MHAIVIGGGITGLACAYRHQQLCVPVNLLERSERVGGVIDSVQQAAFLFDLGPQSFLSTEPLLALIAELGLQSEFVEAHARAPRYILLGGRLRRAPISPQAVLTTSLLSSATKWRLLTEPLRSSQPPDADESVADFVRRKFGEELLDRLVAPVISGIYAGDPEKLSLRSAFPDVYRWEAESGIVIRGAFKSRSRGKKYRPTLCSFRSGVAALLRALSKKLGEVVHTSVAVASLEAARPAHLGGPALIPKLRDEASPPQRADGADGRYRFQVQVSRRGQFELLTADSVVVATDAAAAGQLLAPLSTRFQQVFAQIEYAPVALVSAGYRREQVGHPLEGFGFLVPRQEGLRLLGTVWNSSLFPGRAPEGMVSLTSFVGGSTDAAVFELSDAQIAETVDRELAGVLSIHGPAVTRFLTRYPRALPQYNLGHLGIVAALRNELTRFPGLFLTGNYLRGPSIGVCVEQAFSAAQAVMEYLTSSL
jgi:oxygen-dependent protoporphyrinogen oxidase